MTSFRATLASGHGREGPKSADPQGGTRRLLRVVQAGYKGECHALAHHPTLDGLCASGDTYGVLRFWDTAERRPLAGKTFKSDRQIWCMAFSPVGDLLALGVDEGLLVSH